MTKLRLGNGKFGWIYSLDVARIIFLLMYIDRELLAR